MAGSWTLTARWIFPVSSPPLACGTVTIRDDVILAVEPAGVRKADVDLGDAAVLPGLVNAHTHLDLGGLRGRLTQFMPFADWLRAVVAYRRSTAPSEWKQAIHDGIAESIRSGTTLLGDISADGGSAQLLRDAHIRSVVFHEVIGLTKPRARQTWQAASAWLDQHSAADEPRRGISPHAPYSVRRGLLRLAARKAQQRQLPVAIHFAETREEADLLATHGGPLRKYLEALGAWDGKGLARSQIEILHQFAQSLLPALTRPGSPVLPPVVLIHANHADPGLVARLPGSAVVYCPRTHAYFGHSPHPFRQMLAAGINVALGTDSLASSPDLSILREMQFIHRLHPDLPGELLLRMGTLNGARALGRDAETGSLEPGKSADLITLRYAVSGSDCYRPLWESSAEPLDVCMKGQWVIRNGQPVGALIGKGR